jgi:putative colanic acid biosynthesis UDP-glucose lipid carrier transferase
MQPTVPAGVTTAAEQNVLAAIGREMFFDPQNLGEQARRVVASRAKRTMDFALSLALMVVFLPALLLVALLIKVDSRGPVLFKQERYGQGKQVFLVYKFRTMHVAESSGPFVQARRDDARLTRIGWLLRRTSFDEMPQLVNVIRGEMSLVGPRPHALTMDDEFGKLLPSYADRHLVKPGMTGLAQVAGYRGPTMRYEAIIGRMMRDRIYIQRWSPWLDLKILARTPISLLLSDAF